MVSAKGRLVRCGLCGRVCGVDDLSKFEEVITILVSASDFLACRIFRIAAGFPLYVSSVADGLLC